MNARSRFSVAAAWLYPSTIRRGSGTRAAASGSSLFTMCPRNERISSPSTSSNTSDRGFANCPAIRPTFTTGSVAPYVSTADIWSMIFSFSRIRIVESSLNDSTQSPTWSRNARRSIAFASCSRSARASPANTSGGLAFSRSTTAHVSTASGHSGCCSARRSRHESGLQVADVTAISSIVPV